MQDPFGLLRQMTSELDHVFDNWQLFRGPAIANRMSEDVAWSPKIDVVERNNRIVTRVDLPGLTKKDVSVEVKDGYLMVSGERRRESKENKENWFRSEREYGRFYRAVPMPEGVKADEVRATFTDGMLEVSVPLPARFEAKPTKIEIEEGVKAAKTAA